MRTVLKVGDIKNLWGNVYLRQLDLHLICTQIKPSLTCCPWAHKVNMLTHTCPHKLMMKLNVAICDHQVESLFYLWSGVYFGDLQACTNECDHT